MLFDKHKNWNILESIEELLILENTRKEELLLINTDTEEMLFYSYGIWGVNNEDIIEKIEKIDVEKYVVELYKKSNLFKQIEEYNKVEE